LTKFQLKIFLAVYAIIAVLKHAIFAILFFNDCFVYLEFP